MKTNLSSNLMVRHGAGDSFFQKMLFAFLILALLYASLPVHAALAAPTGPARTFEQEWKNKLYWVKLNGSFYERVRVYPADFKDPDELVMAHEILNQYGVALRGANTVIANRSGFDAKGKVTNNELAEKSLKDLSAYVREMRILKAKLDRLDGKYKLLPPGAVTTAASQ